MPKFRKKPVVIEAVQFGGVEDIPKIFKFCPTAKSQINVETMETRFIIPTLEGDHICSRGDWIIRGIAGEFYPCKNEVFQLSYERVDNDEG